MPLPFNHTLQRHALERLFNHWRNARSRSMSGPMQRTSKQAWAKARTNAQPFPPAKIQSKGKPLYTHVAKTRLFYFH